MSRIVRIPANFEPPRLSPSQQSALRQLAAENHTIATLLMIERYRIAHKPLNDFQLRHEAMQKALKKS